MGRAPSGSIQEGLPKKPAVFFQSPRLSIQEHFLVSVRESVMWEATWYSLTIASGKPSTTSLNDEEPVPSYG